MQRSISLIFPVALFFSFLFAMCGNDSHKASTDLVTNPVTAGDTSKHPEDAPFMSFTENIHDFGTLVQGDVVTYKFKFTNTGKSDLIIANASASCGCTIPSYPKEPIKPGADGVIDVQFNSHDKGGKFEKTVTLTANTIPTETILAIKGEVISGDTTKRVNH
jgi:hypothetical protein